MAPRKKKKEEKPEDKEQVDGEIVPLEEVLPMLMEAAGQKADQKPKVTGIYGDVNEEKCAEIVYSLYMLREQCRISKFEKNEETGELEETIYVKPIEFVVSTYGGSASEMFGVYDVMRVMKEEIPIHTFGVGKVMSAGVLLLAAGTKGERRIGANCRVMIHGILAGQHGYLPDIENEFEEAKFTQQNYINSLAAETNMKPAYIRKLMQRKSNVYISAKEAVELGIADIIV